MLKSSENPEGPKLGNNAADSVPDTWRSRFAATLRRPFWILSPTWGLAEVLKTKDKSQRACVIRWLNCVYLCLSILITILTVVIAHDHAAVFRPVGFSRQAIFLQWLLLSRFWEIGFAFLRDAQDKLRPKRASSDLHWSERVKLALRSYLELILLFGLIYVLLPRTVWVNSGSTTPPDRVTDMIWYSANVVTTSGGGGYLPDSPWAKLLSAGEVLCGVILLVVSFTVYVTRALGGKPSTLR